MVTLEAWDEDVGKPDDLLGRVCFSYMIENAGKQADLLDTYVFIYMSQSVHVDIETRLL